MARFRERISQKEERKVKVDDFKEELWDTVVRFGGPVLMATGLDEEAKEELLGKFIHLRETKLRAESR